MHLDENMTQNDVLATFAKLPEKYKLLLTRTEISVIIQKMNEYLEKSANNHLNETTFMSLVQYVKREFDIKGKAMSKEAIKAVIEAKNLEDWPDEF
ncbi:hypothetical protein AAG747_14565 [Rapidithrix thailandica]|uniref:Uncharacterized protein n=1 Tax=Rapidithrix thailandica TaxID=413964 RepID=A0AAW9S5K8_9BACT